MCLSAGRVGGDVKEVKRILRLCWVRVSDGLTREKVLEYRQKLVDQYLQRTGGDTPLTPKKRKAEEVKKGNGKTPKMGKEPKHKVNKGKGKVAVTKKPAKK